MKHGDDYIDRIIATVRQVHDLDNSWASWSNALADEVEELREELLSAWLSELYTPKGVRTWLANADTKGWTTTQCLQRVDWLRTGAIS